MRSDSPVVLIGTQVGTVWKHIAAACQLSEIKRNRLKTLLTASESGFPENPGDLSAVAFGSLARAEYTLGSDLDWALLVDGSASPDHFEHMRAWGGLGSSLPQGLFTGGL